MNFQVDSQSIEVNIADKTELLSTVAARLASGDGFALATINLDHLVKLRHSESFRAAYKAHDMVVADGNPVVWLSRLAGHSIHLIPGSDIVVPLAAEAARAGVRVALVGSTDAALQAASAAMCRAVPGLDIAMRVTPPMGFDVDSQDAQALLAEMEERKIGLCFLALGAPKQERLAARGRLLAPHVGFASVGAGLDFLAGTQIRAPLWMRRMSLEWLWRILQNPVRMAPRYAACAVVLPRLAVEAWRLRRKERSLVFNQTTPVPAPAPQPIAEHPTCLGKLAHHR